MGHLLYILPTQIGTTGNAKLILIPHMKIHNDQIMIKKYVIKYW